MHQQAKQHQIPDSDNTLSVIKGKTDKELILDTDLGGREVFFPVIFSKKKQHQKPTHCMVDHKLRHDAQQGDRRAQYKLYQRCFNVLMSVCMRYRKSEEEAASMVNMGFLKIIQNLEKYQQPAPFEAWIRRIMINTLIDDFRKNRKVNELIEDRDFTDTDNHIGLVNFNTADLDFDASDLETMIRQLPPMSMKVFNLYAVDGYSHKEIGNMLGISEGTSKWHLSSSRSKLREMMEREGIYSWRKGTGATTPKT